MSKSDWFVKDNRGKERTGVLMKLEENEHSRYEFEVWFEYTRRAMNDIREGTMLAVPNYATTQKVRHYSIIEVTSIKPIHYAIGENPSGFPGFVMEAAKNAAQDWTGQDDDPTEDTTTIQCTAIPTNLELVEEDGKYTFRTEENIPMVGSIVNILGTEPTRQVVNRDIDLEVEKDELFIGGKLTRDANVEVYVRTEDLIQVHFGVFGFTGAGKSNLLSTYIAKLLTGKVSVKVVLFDLMGEYTGLLIDQLNSNKLGTAYVIALGERTLPGPVIDYLNKVKNAPDVSKAAESLNRITLLPKRLQKEKIYLQVALAKLLEGNKVKVFSEIDNLTIYYLFYDYNNSQCPSAFKKRVATNLKEQRKTIIKTVLDQCLQAPRDYKGQKDYKRITLNKSLAEELIKVLNQELAKPENREFHKDKGGDFEGVIGQITSAIPLLESISPAAISMSQILTDLNDKASGSSIYIIQAHNPSEMREFAATFGEAVYESRRRSGEIRPLVSFIFDEADEFIPLSAKGSYERSKEIVATLARRGRKFGLGVGIATQRTRYLDTSIMAQPHTYLVSKLPRSNDRAVVAEAFGVSEDMFRQTFKFKPGNWLIMSHDATGLKAIPVPIQTEDANERLKKYLETLGDF